MITNFNGSGVGLGFGVGCGFGVGWGFGGMPLNILGLGAGGGCGVGWGFGSAYDSQYRSSRVAFQGLEFGKEDPRQDDELREMPTKHPRQSFVTIVLFYLGQEC